MKLHTLGLLALLCAGGCKSANVRADYPDYGYDPGEGTMAGATDYGRGDRMMDADEAEPAPEPAPAMDPSSARDRRTARRTARQERTVSSEVASPPPTDAAAAAASPAVEPAQPEKAIADETPEIAARHIVYTAGMTIAVFNLEDAMAKAETLPDSYGGYIAQMSSGHLVLRIPSKHLRAAMEELGGFGNVENRSLQAMDVTAQFTDIESRIKALEETHKQLLELLSKARTVQEALQVRQTLDNIATELEVLKGQMRQMQNQISFSTLTVGLYERGPHTPTPSSNDPFPWVNDLGVEATEWK